jgi:hypothetical protein
VQKKGNSVGRDKGEIDLSFTLKDFVTIFQADRVGEKITKKV